MTLTLHDFTARTIDGSDVDLASYDGVVLLVVNTASRCGFTPQYEGLQDLQDRYAGRGFSVLGFPCDQFGGQEPGTEEEIGAFCEGTFGVTFPLFAKVEVNGPNAHPLYRHLRATRRGMFGSRIMWNFTKFLVDRDGRVVRRYAPSTRPERIAGQIEDALVG